MHIHCRPRHEKTCLQAYADSEDPDQPAHPRSGQRLRCPLTESLDTIECISEEQIPGWGFAHVRDDLNSKALVLLTRPTVLICQNKDFLITQLTGQRFYPGRYAFSFHMFLILEHAGSSLCIFRILTLVLLNQDLPCLCKQCSSWSVCLWRTALFVNWHVNLQSNLDQVICSQLEVGVASCFIAWQGLINHFFVSDFS